MGSEMRAAYLLLICLSVAHAGRRGGSLTTMGSFTMSSGGNRGANEEAMLGDSDDDNLLDNVGEYDDAAKDHWDTTQNGKCKENVEAWVHTDAKDHSQGKCVEYEADNKC